VLTLDWLTPGALAPGGSSVALSRHNRGLMR
jgi:hypothetical protein